ncbi:hypothetical protein J2X31_000593 [Flavobacterium arsenatis]|uniref:Uncharacterized protein n=1 Tax=Flavobacterium arsenatis TaxID=1484332 RepID=A0ABU1TKT7_9FLAO|nr:DUF6252 family protein [Flavobacterium arsenatis]MDR6966595.1 hypothetical protein [Flavobacterium arsenatis]
MKKIVSLLIILVLFTSCEENISSNSPSFQASKDNFMWRANDYTAVYNPLDSTLVMTAFKGLEVVKLYSYPVIINGTGASTFFENAIFELGNDDVNSAFYSFADRGVNFEYETGVSDVPNGEIVLENTINQKPGTISGKFRFDAPYVGASESAPERINFQNGVFYEIPITIGVNQ